MATPNWIGNARATVDTWTDTIALTWTAGDTRTLTINGKSLVITIGSLVTTAQVATTIKQAWQSEAFTDTTASCLPTGGGTSMPEFAEITASVSGSVVTLVADTAGVPVTITDSSSTAGDGTATLAHSVTASGPNYFDNTANSSTGSLPVSTDTWTIDRAVSILYALSQSAIELTAMTITERFTTAARIGLLFRNTLGYEEYRATELAISATTWTNRSSSSLIKQNFGSVQTTVHNYSSGTSAETGRPAVQLRGTHASNVFNIYGGDVGIGSNGETATAATARQEGGTLNIGSAVTLTTFNHIAGTANVYCAATTITSNDGNLTHHSGNITTLNINGSTVIEKGSGTITTVRQTSGDFTTANTATVTTLDKSGGTAVLYGPVTTVTNESGAVTVDSGNVTTFTITKGTGYYNGVGTITTLTVDNDGIINFDGGNAGCTVTNCTLTGNAKIIDTANRVTWTNAIAWAGTLSVKP